MKKLILMGILAGISWSALAGQTYEVRPGVPCLVLRKKSTYHSRALDCLPARTEVQILRRSAGNGYSYVQVGNQRGYMWTGYMRKSKGQVADRAVVSTVNGTPTDAPSSKDLLATGEPSKEISKTQELPFETTKTSSIDVPKATPTEMPSRPPRSLQDTLAMAGTRALAPTPSSLSASLPSLSLMPKSDFTTPPPALSAVSAPSRTISQESPMLSASPASPIAVDSKPVEIPVNTQISERKIANDSPEVPTTEVADDSSPAPVCNNKTLNNVSVWNSVQSVMQEGIVPRGKGYNLGSPSWPTLVENGGKLTVNFGPSKQSMCTSATAVAFMKHIADLQNAGAFKLTAQQIAYLNRSWKTGAKADDQQVKNGLNGDTNSIAMLFQYLGGHSLEGYRKRGSNDQIIQVLKQAKRGDFMKIDRAVGGHSTIFKEFKNGKVCYFSSNRSTGGVSDTRCEPVSALRDVVISRFPEDVCSLPEKLDNMMNNAKLKAELKTTLGYNERKGVENPIPPNWIHWGFSTPQVASSSPNGVQ